MTMTIEGWKRLGALHTAIAKLVYCKTPRETSEAMAAATTYGELLEAMRRGTAAYNEGPENEE